MKNELKVAYEKLAELFEEWYGIKKENTYKLLYEHGHNNVMENPSLIGLNEEQSDEIKRAFDILNFYNENREVLNHA